MEEAQQVVGDAEFRLAELAGGKSRDHFVREVFDSAESRQRQQWQVLEKLDSDGE